jgi:uncharacterized protein (TIGR03067 family)
MTAPRRVVHTLFTAALMAFCAIVVAAQKPAPAPPTKGAAAMLQGDWIITTINGQSLADAGTSMMLSFTGDKYAQTVDGTVNERGSFKVDTAKKPMTLDLTITEGGDAGKLQVGVFQITAGTLTASLAMPGATARPTDFTVQEGFILFVATKRK